MAEKKRAEKASIISVIQRMVASGESEENIIKTLRGLGVGTEQAKRLLLLAEANTFAVLQNEIGKIVRDYVEEEKPKLVAFIREEAKKAEKEMTDKVEKRALNAFREDQLFIENQAMMFQARVNQSVKNILQLNEQTKASIRELASRLSNTERDTWALKHRVFGSKVTKGVSGVLIALQVALIAASAYLFITPIESGFAQPVVTVMVIGSILATMVYLVGLRG